MVKRRDDHMRGVQFYRYRKDNFGPKGYYRNIDKDNIIFYEHVPRTTKYDRRAFDAIQGNYVYTNVKLDRYKNGPKVKKGKLPFFITVNKGKDKAFILKGSNISKRKINKRFVYDQSGKLVKSISEGNNYWVLYNKNNPRPKIGKSKGLSQKKNVNKLISTKPLFKMIGTYLRDSPYGSAYNKMGIGKEAKDKIKKALRRDLVKLILGAKIISKYKNHSKTTLGDLLISRYILTGGQDEKPMNESNLNNYVNNEPGYTKAKNTIIKEINYLPHIIKS